MKPNTPDNPYRKFYGTEGNPTGVALYIRPKAKFKMDAYVRLVPVEVGWMGLIKQHERKDPETGFELPSILVLEDVFLYEQEVSGGSVDSGIKNGIDLSVVLQKMIDEGKQDQIPMIRFFGHSHANMGVYHSGTDQEMIDDWALTGLPWIVSWVQNKKGEVNVRYDQFLPFRVSAPVSWATVLDQEAEQSCAAEIEKYVSEKTYPSFQGHQTQPWNTTRRQTPLPNHSANKGMVISDDWKAQFADDYEIDPTQGTVQHPIIKHKTFEHTGTNKDIEVRQEIVKGLIIHEATVGTPAAKARVDLSLGERWQFFNGFLSNNARLARRMREAEDRVKAAAKAGGKENPTKEVPASRSIQRSADRRQIPETSSTSTTNNQSDGKSEASKRPTPTPIDPGSDSKEEPKESSEGKQEKSKSEGNNRSNKKNNARGTGEKEHVIAEKEQETLSVVSAEDGEYDLEDEIREQMEQYGFAI